MGRVARLRIDIDSRMHVPPAGPTRPDSATIVESCGPDEGVATGSHHRTPDDRQPPAYRRSQPVRTVTTCPLDCPRNLDGHPVAIACVHALWSTAPVPTSAATSPLPPQPFDSETSPIRSRSGRNPGPNTRPRYLVPSPLISGLIWPKNQRSSRCRPVVDARRWALTCLALHGDDATIRGNIRDPSTSYSAANLVDHLTCRHVDGHRVDVGVFRRFTRNRRAAELDADRSIGAMSAQWGTARPSSVLPAHLPTTSTAIVSISSRDVWYWRSDPVVTNAVVEHGSCVEREAGRRDVAGRRAGQSRELGPSTGDQVHEVELVAGRRSEVVDGGADVNRAIRCDRSRLQVRVTRREHHRSTIRAQIHGLDHRRLTGVEDTCRSGSVVVHEGRPVWGRSGVEDVRRGRSCERPPSYRRPRTPSGTCSRSLFPCGSPWRRRAARSPRRTVVRDTRSPGTPGPPSPATARAVERSAPCSSPPVRRRLPRRLALPRRDPSPAVHRGTAVDDAAHAIEGAVRGFRRPDAPRRRLKALPWRGAA